MQPSRIYKFLARLVSLKMDDDILKVISLEEATKIITDHFRGNNGPLESSRLQVIMDHRSITGFLLTMTPKDV